MRNLLFPQTTCRYCEGSIAKGEFFCKYCGRDRLFGIKGWELSAGVLIGLAGLFLVICLGSSLVAAFNTLIPRATVASTKKPTRTPTPDFVIKTFNTSTPHPTNTRKPTSIPSTRKPTSIPSSTPSNFPEIESLAFCMEQDFDSLNELCRYSSQVFARNIDIIYVSWIYRGEARGRYSRIWYGNDVVIPNLHREDIDWGYDGERHYTWIQVEGGLPPGQYRLEFRLDNQNDLIQQGSFTIQ